jgi:hypothetical protein
MTKLCLLPVVAACLSLPTLAASDPRREDANRAAVADTSREAQEILARLTAPPAGEDRLSPSASSPPLALAVVPGDAASLNIALTLFNLSPFPLQVATLDPFRALDGQALLIETVFPFTFRPPPFGALVVEYPAAEEAGKGPAVLSFSGFEAQESASFNLDPDAYEDPDSGVTLQDLDGTRIELVFAEGRRGVGKLVFQPDLNGALAVIFQTFP